jgi:RNA-directed DNA polymerase
MALASRIVSSLRTGHEVPPVLFTGDDLALVADRAPGVPTGNLTSQLWGDFYLDAIDHWIAEEHERGAYVRYTDDFLLFSEDKARFGELRSGIVEQLATLRLKLAELKSRLLVTREGSLLRILTHLNMRQELLQLLQQLEGDKHD